MGRGAAHLHSRNVVHGGEPSTSPASAALGQMLFKGVVQEVARGMVHLFSQRRAAAHPALLNTLAEAAVQCCGPEGRIADSYFKIHLGDDSVGCRADLKGGNVLLKSAENARGFEAKVADFGLARALGIESRMQSNKYGTVTHCPPELLVEGTVSKVWSLQYQSSRRTCFCAVSSRLHAVQQLRHRHALPARAAGRRHRQQGMLGKAQLCDTCIVACSCGPS